MHYNVNGEVGIMDKALGQFRINDDFDLNFRLWKDTVNFYARGYVSNTLPSFYMRHYHSNHYYWDNYNMDKEFRTRVAGELNIDRWKTNLRAGVENIKNYTYFNQSGMPKKESGNIQVLSATLKQDFRLGILHLDNEVTWQKSSNETVLPLPQLSLYHNLYICLLYTSGKEVSWMPAYGPEQRGGTANVTVIVSDEKISSPILSKYDAAIILNQPSLEKFENKVKPGGVLIYDGYGIINPPTRKDIHVYRIDAMDAANEMNNAKAFNMIVLGGLLKIAPIVTLENVIKGLKKTLPERHHHLIPMNEEAIKRGMELIKEV